MLIFETLEKTWPMCLASLGVLWGTAALSYKARVPRLEGDVSPRVVFWSCLVLWFVLLSVCLTLIDRPHFGFGSRTQSWLFMFSAFLGIPATVPLLACAVWAMALHTRGETLKRSELLLLALGGLGLGGAASNIHDIVWCGAITDCFSQHFEAGYDLDLFVAFGERFGISREVLADYATLGPYAMVLVTGELTVAAAAFMRLRRLRAGNLHESSLALD